MKVKLTTLVKKIETYTLEYELVEGMKLTYYGKDNEWFHSGTPIDGEIVLQEDKLCIMWEDGEENTIEDTPKFRGILKNCGYC
jgi:hypothetical protein